MRKTTKHLIATLSVVIALVIVLSMSLIACDHTHNYSEQGKDENYHWNYCPDDEEIDETSKEAHKDENSDGKCDVCGYDGMHVHDYTAQGKDSTQHWNYCPTDNAVDQSSKSSHVDSDVNGYCDVCGYEMGIVSEEVVKIELVEGVPTLIVKGNLPEFSEDGEPVEIGCVKLHADGDGNNLYWDNLCAHKWGYEFQAPLSDLTYGNGQAPWYWFHIYAYADATPEDNAQYIGKQDLNRGSLLSVEQSLEYNGSSYTVKAWSDGNTIGDGLAIESKFFYEMNVFEINVDQSNGLELVVKGTVSDHITYLALHASGNGSDEWFGTPVAVNEGAFEARFDITQLTVVDTPWCWFHIYLSTSESSEGIEYVGKYNVQRGEMVPGNLSLDNDGIRYSVIDSQSQLVIQPTVIPSFSVSEVSVDTTDGLKLIVKGTLSESQKCLVIHADGNDSDEWFGEKATINGNNFEAEFDLTQLKLEGTPYCYFKVYTYAEENPADYNEGKQESNLPLGNIEYGAHFDYNGIRYNVINPGWEGQLVIQPKEYIYRQQ